MLYETILVAQTIFSECRAKNEQEAIAIANVILNRSKGQNMERVIKKPSQFCYTQKIGKYELKNWLKSMEIARLTILGIYKDEFDEVFERVLITRCHCDNMF